MKFIRDIIGEKRTQAVEPAGVLYDNFSAEDDASFEAPQDDWADPDFDLSARAPDPMIEATEDEFEAAPADADEDDWSLDESIGRLAETDAPEPEAASEAEGEPNGNALLKALILENPIEDEPQEEETAEEAPRFEAEPEPEMMEESAPEPTPTFGLGQAEPDPEPAPELEAEAPEIITALEIREVAEEVPAAPAAAEIPAPTPGRVGRVKTRLLGFNGDAAFPSDPIKRQGAAQTDADQRFPIGWLTIIDGPGRGVSFTLQNGVAQIGRSESQRVRLDFGDTSISRENHAAIAYDSEQNTTYIGHGGKANLVRCNDLPVLSTQELNSGDCIRIGETTLLFTSLCGPGFSWAKEA